MVGVVVDCDSQLWYWCVAATVVTMKIVTVTELLIVTHNWIRDPKIETMTHN